MSFDALARLTAYAHNLVAENDAWSPEQKSALNDVLGEFLAGVRAAPTPLVAEQAATLAHDRIATRAPIPSAERSALLDAFASMAAADPDQSIDSVVRAALGTAAAEPQGSQAAAALGEAASQVPDELLAKPEPKPEVDPQPKPAGTSRAQTQRRPQAGKGDTPDTAGKHGAEPSDPARSAPSTQDATDSSHLSASDLVNAGVLPGVTVAGEETASAAGAASAAAAAAEAGIEEGLSTQGLPDEGAGGETAGEGDDDGFQEVRRRPYRRSTGRREPQLDPRQIEYMTNHTTRSDMSLAEQLRKHGGGRSAPRLDEENPRVLGSDLPRATGVDSADARTALEQGARYRNTPGISRLVRHHAEGTEEFARYGEWTVDYRLPSAYGRPGAGPGVRYSTKWGFTGFLEDSDRNPAGLQTR